MPARVISPGAAFTQVGASVVPLLCRTCPALPLASIAVVPAADWYGICPPSPAARLVAVVALVAVPALPVTLPEIGAVTVRLPSVPTEVKDEETTFAASVVPVKVPAAAVAVMFILEVPSKETPLIVLGVASAVAVPALPVTLPEIGAVTVRLPSIPTEVKDEETTFAASVVPVKVAASAVAVTLILDVPSKATPLMVLGLARAVAVAALPVTLPEIGAVTVKLPSVPTEVKDEDSTFAARVAPVKVPAAAVAVMLMLEVPSKATPLIVLGVASAVAVPALPVTLPEIGAVTVRLPSVPTEVNEELTIVGLSVVPASVLASAEAEMLILDVPSKATPLIVRGVASLVAVPALPITLPEIGAVTVRLPSVPTEVKEEESTLPASVAPVKVAASAVAVILMLEVPSKATPLIVLGVARAVAVAALPPMFKAVAVPVIFVPTNALGVPRFGVTNVGDVANTAAPVPVSSFKAPAKPAELVKVFCLPAIAVLAALSA
jgi:hypothetical protein